MPIDPTAHLAADVVIYHPNPVNLYGCRIGARTMIGAFVEIQVRQSAIELWSPQVRSLPKTSRPGRSSRVYRRQ